MQTNIKIILKSLVILFLVFFSFSRTASAQFPVSGEGFDLSGMWAAILHEDFYDRIPGSGLGEYTGIPINAAARQKAEAWDASILSQPSRQAQPHPAQYSFRGPFPNLRIDRIMEPITGRIIGYRTEGTYGNADRTIWLDGRPHPDELIGYHAWNGFSTGEWQNGVLVVTTTHMKYGVYQRNGVPASPYGRMSEFWFLNGEYLTIVSSIEDPIYLEEPMVRSQTWVRNPPQILNPPELFEPVEEVAKEPGWVPHWPLGTKHTEMAERLGVAVDATTGGSVTLYPEYRETLRQMREEFDRSQAVGTEE